MTHICKIYSWLLGTSVMLGHYPLSCPALFAREGHFKFNSPAERSENAALN